MARELRKVLDTLAMSATAKRLGEKLRVEDGVQGCCKIIGDLEARARIFQ